MDKHFARVLLALRRFIGVPLPGTPYRIRGLIRTENERIRVKLGSEENAEEFISLDLPVYQPGSDEQFGMWWYVSALRRFALHACDTSQENPAGTVIDGARLLASGVLLPHGEVSPDDSVDYIIADLVGDPLWYEAEASAYPELFELTGFDLRSRDTLRVYLLYKGRTIGVDFATVDSESGASRSVNWWAATKLVSAINPEDSTLLAHEVHGAEDPYCQAVYDLTNWA